MTSHKYDVIPIVALGEHRAIASSMDPLFAGTLYRPAAIMDLNQEPESVRYSAQNLTVVLYNLHPRPKVIIIGSALSQEIAVESTAVWNSYVDKVKEEDTLLINVGTVNFFSNVLSY